jgi:predicted SnoaL-like aldol condensation-catalyzing enzyme
MSPSPPQPSSCHYERAQYEPISPRLRWHSMNVTPYDRRKRSFEKFVIPPGEELLKMVGTWERCRTLRPDGRFSVGSLSVMLVALWSPNYLQHSAHIKPGRDGPSIRLGTCPLTFRHEHEQIVTDGELVIVHSRFSGFGQAKDRIVASFVRVVDGILVEHREVSRAKRRRPSPRVAVRCSVIGFLGSRCHMNSLEGLGPHSRVRFNAPCRRDPYRRTLRSTRTSPAQNCVETV